MKPEEVQAMEFSLTVGFTFEAAHCLPEHRGECSRLHGHSYRLEVTVSGPVGPDGMVVDFGRLKQLVRETVIDRVDHRYLNELYPFAPTCENLALRFWQDLQEALRAYPRLKLSELVLWETPDARVRLARAAPAPRPGACGAARQEPEAMALRSTKRSVRGRGLPAKCGGPPEGNKA